MRLYLVTEMVKKEMKRNQKRTEKHAKECNWLKAKMQDMTNMQTAQKY